MGCFVIVRFVQTALLYITLGSYLSKIGLGTLHHISYPAQQLYSVLIMSHKSQFHRVYATSMPLDDRSPRYYIAFNHRKQTPRCVVRFPVRTPHSLQTLPRDSVQSLSYLHLTTKTLIWYIFPPNSGKNNLTTQRTNPTT